MNAYRFATLAAVLAIGLSLVTGLAYADRDDWRNAAGDRYERQDRHDRRDYRRNERYEYRERYAERDRRKEDYRKVPKGYVYDKRFHHDRYYPRSGYIVQKLPSERYRIPYHDTYYYFHGGVWYRPHRSQFIVVAPPIGLFIPTLPAFYTTIWFGGIPYYYANDVYYVWDASRDGYVVTNPPPNATGDEQPPVASEQMFIYPNKGQSEKQQADDRYACHRWGVKQTNFDPTQPPNNISQDEINQKRMDYQRAMRACLEGRGYTVR